MNQANTTTEGRLTHHSLIEDANRSAKSITHKHILSIINTILKDPPKNGRVRILDAGCGDCELLSYLETFVASFQSDLDVEVHGFDVFDSKVQFDDFFIKARRMLSMRHGNIDWRNRLKSISTVEAWPYDDESFDIVISNQVVEHINDHEFFFSQNWRVLKRGGVAIHLFPVKNYIMEGHVQLPFVHRIRQWHLLYRTIKTLSRLRLGKWKAIKDHCSLDDFSKSYADFLTYYCNYTSLRELVTWGKKCGFRTGFDFTGKFYTGKLKDIFKIKHDFFYQKRNAHFFSVHFFKYIQCITLLLEKKNEYVNYIAAYNCDPN